MSEIHFIDRDDPLAARAAQASANEDAALESQVEELRRLIVEQQRELVELQSALIDALSGQASKRS